MTAKNKDDFLFQLHNELHRIGVDNSEEIFADFEEHFRASAEQGLSEEQTCENLGDIKEIARSYVDIESTAINSILANAIEDARPHVSLTKPGRDFPASVPVQAEEPEQPVSIREYTPEHIAEEQPAPSQPVSSIREFTPEHIAQEPDHTAAETTSERSYTPEHNAPEQPAPEKEEPAAQSIPTPEQQKTQAAHTAELPKQDGTNGKKNENSFRFSDLKGMTPNINAGKLIGQILMDVLLWSWLVPMLVSITCSIFGTAVGGIFGIIFNTILPFHPLSKIFLGVGLFSLGILIILFGVQMIKWIIKLIKFIVVGHIKAIYDL